MSNTNPCPIWETQATTRADRRDGQYADSPRAGGRYFISRHAEVNLRNDYEAVKARLTTWLVDQRRLGVECPEIMSATIDEVTRRQPLRVYERADRLLAYIETQLQTIGATISVKPIVTCPNF